MATRADIDDFLAQRRIALVGVSRDPGKFQNQVFRRMVESGYDMVPINPTTTEVEGVHALPTIRQVLGPLDGVLVMVSPPEAVRVVRDCVAMGVPRVWLHRGAGPGAVSEAAVRICRDEGIRVVDGACPLMYLEPVVGLHRLHRLLHRVPAG